ncbi:MAG: hypothetical protein Q7R30_12510 [Acidobacteriota bacterium]|nr:hypothetical protein [Acidobacteriota bacterium]
MRVSRLFAFAGVVYATGFSVAVAQRTGAFAESLNHPAILYSTTAANTVVDELNRKLADGSAALTFDEQSGYLKSVLDLLKVPVESQLLVYSPTSQQAEKINPQNPRAIYFNDNVSVGYVRGGGILEIVAQDARLGSVFYVVHQQAGAARNLGREQQCLRCHLSWDTLGVPGMSVLSTFPRKTKDDYANGFFVDHYRPIAQRWGGWYVTGKRVPAKHMGNFPLFMPKPALTPPPARVSMAGQIDLTSYLTPYSDIVALMVLEHQVHAANLMTRANWEARLNQPARVTEAVETLVDYLLFVDEAPIPAGGIEGSSGFAEKFQATGPRDSKGRSLRDFDLNTRLMNYPLSYMIYSQGFAALPPAAKEMAMDRIKRVLSGEITGPNYARLTPAIRQATTEILKETM